MWQCGPNNLSLSLSLSLSQPEHVYLMEEGLDLWYVSLTHHFQFHYLSTPSTVCALHTTLINPFPPSGYHLFTTLPLAPPTFSSW